MSKMIKKFIRRNRDENLPVKAKTPMNVDLEGLNNLLVNFCSKALEKGEIDKAGALLKYIGFIKNIQIPLLTYERAFILNHLERHGLIGDNFKNNIKKYPLTLEEAEELKEIFGDQIESIKELTG